MIVEEALAYLTFPANVSQLGYLNLALEWLLHGYEGENSRDLVTFVVQPDVNGQGFITMPRRYLAPRGIVQTDPTGICGWPIQVRNGWYEYSPGAIGMLKGSDYLRGVIPIQGRFRTFLDWTIPAKMNFVFEQDEGNDNQIIVRGTYQGNRIFTQNGSDWIEGEAVDITTGSPSPPVTTVNNFDLPPYQIIKPVTKGRVFMYAETTEPFLPLPIPPVYSTLVAIYDPTERSPRWKRFKVPIRCAPPGTTTYFSAVCKKAFVPVTNNDDELPIDNLNALQAALDALAKRDSNDYARQRQLLSQSEESLNRQSGDETGPNAEGNIAFDDEFGMNEVGNMFGYGGW